MDRRLARYRPIPTDPLIDAELQRIIRSGLVSQTDLPLVPPAPEPSAAALADDDSGGASRRRINPRRRPG